MEKSSFNTTIVSEVQFTRVTEFIVETRFLRTVLCSIPSNTINCSLLVSYGLLKRVNNLK